MSARNEIFVNNHRRLILGMGATGLSCARYLNKQGLAFDMADSRSMLANYDQIVSDYPDSKLMLGEFTVEQLTRYDELIVSPGIALATPAIQQAIAAGVVISSDIDIFSKVCETPFIAITGSNGKSTVTTLVAHLLQGAGYRVTAGGNLGLPALDLLSQAADFYVVELSSFQLETVTNLNATAATILNLSADHMDRYSGMAGYLEAKQAIFNGCQTAVVNLDEQGWQPDVARCATTQTISFSLHSNADLGLLQSSSLSSSAAMLVMDGQKNLIDVDHIPLSGQHNIANVLAAFALIKAIGIDPQTTLPALSSYQGLPHRSQCVGIKNGVTFVDDSKGTNVGSTLAAITGLADSVTGRLWLIVGGVGKDQDFSPLKDACSHAVYQTYAFGRDAQLIVSALGADNNVTEVTTLDAVFEVLIPQLNTGDLVLFSPACASFDQFDNYIARGLYFQQLVEGVSQ